MKIYDWTSKFEFGKYIDFSVEEIFKSDVGYLIWFHTNIFEIFFTDEIVMEIVKFANATNDELTAVFDNDLLKAEIIKTERKLEYLKLQDKKWKAI